jgi:hypothetical protein
MNVGRSVALLGMLVVPLMGQVMARQGTAADLKQSEFSSPIVIEVPLTRLKAQEPGDFYAFTDQDKFVCDDVSIPIILIKKSINWSKQVELNIKTTVYVRPSFDRKVTLQYSIIQTGSALNLRTLQEISAKEKQNRSDSSTVVLSKDAFEGLLNSENPGMLKLVMTVTPDR